MEMITGSKVETLIDVKTIVEKQGFKVHTIREEKEFTKYRVCAQYGDTKEIYWVIVNPISGEYTVES